MSSLIATTKHCKKMVPKLGSAWKFYMIHGQNDHRERSLTIIYLQGNAFHSLIMHHSVVTLRILALKSNMTAGNEVVIFHLLLECLHVGT